MASIGKPLDSNSLPYQTVLDQQQTTMRKLEALAEQIKLGGGKKNIEKQHEKGKLTARERIEKLIDAGSDFLEIGLYAAHGLYQEEGGAPSAGVVVGIGTVSGKLCVIVA